MTKVVLLREGYYLCLSTKAMLELIRRGSPGIKVTEHILRELSPEATPEMRSVIEHLNQHDALDKYVPIEGESEYLVHYFYKFHIAKGNLRYSFDGNRADPVLVQLVEEIGAEVLDNSNYKTEPPVIVDIPDGIEWGLENDEDNEWVSEKHRTWQVGYDGKVYEDTRP